MIYKVICPFCGNSAEWVENKAVYRKNFGRSYMIWLCLPCDAYVGCHNNTREPLGTMANSETRKWRRKAREAFDQIFRKSIMNRKTAYQKIWDYFGFEIHIGESDVAQCKLIIKWANKILGD